jgi:hypothetical protein
MKAAMSELKVRPLSRADGIYASIEGLGLPFRFRIGSGEIKQVDHPGAFMWIVDGAIGSYHLHCLPHEFEVAAGAEPFQVLAEHFRWETEFLRERVGVTVDESKVGTFLHPSGRPILTWVNVNSKADVNQNVTPFAVQATLMHSERCVVHFSVTGVGHDWIEEDVRSQVVRAALSYFPLRATAAVDLESKL